MTKIKEVEAPVNSIYKDFILKIDYTDAFEIEIPSKNISIEELYVGIFSSAPKWVEWLMSLRNKIVTLFGLKTEMLDEQSNELIVGQRRGIFHIYYVNENEVIAGEDDKHLNFRVSILKEDTKVTISTFVQFNNKFGKFYMKIIAPFHKIIVKAMMKRYLKNI